MNNYKETQTMTREYQEIVMKVSKKEKKFIETDALKMNLRVSDYARVQVGLRPFYDEGPDREGDSSWSPQ